jgi:hypothetical protein
MVNSCCQFTFSTEIKKNSRIFRNAQVQPTTLSTRTGVATFFMVRSSGSPAEHFPVPKLAPENNTSQWQLILKAATGAAGANSYTYIAYANDASGAGLG